VSRFGGRVGDGVQSNALGAFKATCGLRSTAGCKPPNPVRGLLTRAPRRDERSHVRAYGPARASHGACGQSLSGLCLPPTSPDWRIFPSSTSNHRNTFNQTGTPTNSDTHPPPALPRHDRSNSPTQNKPRTLEFPTAQPQFENPRSSVSRWRLHPEDLSDSARTEPDSAATARVGPTHSGPSTLIEISARITLAHLFAFRFYR